MSHSLAVSEPQRAAPPFLVRHQSHDSLRHLVVQWPLLLAVLHVLLCGQLFLVGMKAAAQQQPPGLFYNLAQLADLGICGLLCIWGLHKKRMNIPFLALTLLFFTYVAFVIVLTGTDTSMLSYLLSKDWMILSYITGLGLGLSLHIMGRVGFFPYWVSPVVGAGMLAVLIQCLGYTEDTLAMFNRTENYQGLSYATSSLVLLLLLLSLQLFQGWWKLLTSLAVVVMTFMLTLAATTMNSNSIVVFTISLLLVSLWAETTLTIRIKGFLLLGLMAGACAWWMLSAESTDIFARTRFALLLEGESLSSIDSRAEIFGSFWSQFSVNPLFGNYRADELAGAGRGYYVHSLPFSLLTHTGVLGFLIFLAMLATAIYPYQNRKQLSELDRLFLGHFLAILVCVSLFAFFTAPIFWLTAGLLTALPQRERAVAT